MSWKATNIKTMEEAVEIFGDLAGKNWLCRGQCQCFGDGLFPSILRYGPPERSYSEQLSIERQSINLFQAMAKNFASQGECRALTDEVVALMVLRHYGVPTRLLDWSTSPYIAAYFASAGAPEKDGEIWCFDHHLYAQRGKSQWRRKPETTTDRTGDDGKFRAQLTMFDARGRYKWIICAFDDEGFPRQNAQHGAYTLAGRIDADHAERLAALLDDLRAHHRYIITAALKPNLREFLQSKHGISRGSLFPDTAGAAETVMQMAGFGALRTGTRSPTASSPEQA